MMLKMIDEIAPGASRRETWRALRAAPRRRAALALAYGVACHVVFALGVGAMVAAMYVGMSRSLGAVPWPYAGLVNAALLLQFPLGHSLLLTASGRRALARLAPTPFGSDMAPTTYAAIASAQIFLLFALWTPSGVVWSAAEGWTLWASTVAYAAAWTLLGKAMLDAGLSLQSGSLGWWSVLRGVRPRYPDMPTRGLFRYTRQPIYVTFALTLWTPPVWTPDQLAVALSLTAYCLVGPLFKEQRFSRLFGDRFAAYREATPYWLPIPKRRRPSLKTEPSPESSSETSPETSTRTEIR